MMRSTPRPPVASLISAAYGWSAVFAIIIGLNVVAAILAMFVLKPMRARYLADDSSAAAVITAQPARAA